MKQNLQITLGLFTLLSFSITAQPKTIYGGYQRSYVLNDDSTICGMGMNNQYVLGDGVYGYHTGSDFVKAKNVSPTLSVSSNGGSHTLFLKKDSTVWACGGNNTGQLGDGTGQQQQFPIYIPNLASIKQITSSSASSYALQNDGIVWAWGDNTYGQIGDSTTANRFVPVKTKISNVKKIAAGYNAVLALKNDGTLWTWGNNTLSGAGYNIKPKQVVGISNVIDVAISKGSRTCFVIKNDSTLWAWGENTFAMLANGNTFDSYSPNQIIGVSHVSSVSVGFQNVLVLQNNGTVWAWGKNAYGEVGDSTYATKYTPVKVKSLSKIKDIASGYYHSLAMDSLNRLSIWGNGYQNTYPNDYIPQKIASTCFNFVVNSLYQSIPEHINLKIYPNPSKDIITIELENTDFDKNAQIDIYSSLSQVVYHASIKESMASFNIAHLNSGIYTIKLNNKGITFYAKIIKE